MVKLVGLASFLEQHSNLDESLNQTAALAANILSSKNCSIMLFREENGADKGPVMKVFASHGYLPRAAYTEKAHHKEGIAGHVAETGEALLIPDIRNSAFAPKARWPDKEQKGFISAPIFIGKKVLGVINVNAPTDDRVYTSQDLALLTAAALVAGKSIQVVQLQNLLKSRFAQLALVQESRAVVSESIAEASQQPEKLSRILAKGFFREMRKSGFSDHHIIGAATEIISLLTAQEKKAQ